MSESDIEKLIAEIRGSDGGNAVLAAPSSSERTWEDELRRRGGGFTRTTVHRWLWGGSVYSAPKIEALTWGPRSIYLVTQGYSEGYSAQWLTAVHEHVRERRAAYEDPLLPGPGLWNASIVVATRELYESWLRIIPEETGRPVPVVPWGGPLLNPDDLDIIRRAGAALAQAQQP